MENSLNAGAPKIKDKKKPTKKKKKKPASDKEPSPLRPLQDEDLIPTIYEPLVELGGVFEVGDPIGALLKEIHLNTIFSLWIEDYEMKRKFGDDELYILAAALRNNTSLVSLQLRHLPITNSSLSALCVSLEKHTAIRSLDFSGCVDVLEAGGWSAVKHLVQMNSRIIHVMLEAPISISSACLEAIELSTEYNRLRCIDPNQVVNPYEHALVATMLQEEEQEALLQAQLTYNPFQETSNPSQQTIPQRLFPAPQKKNATTGELDRGLFLAPSAVHCPPTVGGTTTIKHATGGRNRNPMRSKGFLDPLEGNMESPAAFFVATHLEDYRKARRGGGQDVTERTRPSVPICGAYVYLGSCRFGSRCMYRHPERTVSHANIVESTKIEVEQRRTKLLSDEANKEAVVVGGRKLQQGIGGGGGVGGGFTLQKKYNEQHQHQQGALQRHAFHLVYHRPTALSSTESSHCIACPQEATMSLQGESDGRETSRAGQLTMLPSVSVGVVLTVAGVSVLGGAALFTVLVSRLGMRR